MRILKVYDGDYPWDVRVEKVLVTLRAAGHDVRLLCRNRAGRPRQETVDGVALVRLPALPDPLSFPFFLSPIWIGAVASELRRFRPDRVLVRDLPLAPLCAVAGRRFGVPVIADLAEPYPDSLRSQWQFERMSPLDVVVRSPRLADAVERFVLRRVDRVLVVCPEAGRRLEARGLARERWTEVGNTPLLERFAPSGRPVPAAAGFEDRFRLLFCGLLAGDRGLDTALAALARLLEKEPGRFGLTIVGDGPVRERLEAEVAERGLSNDVRFAGFVAHERLPDVITRAHAGLLPFHACPHINATLANKLFEYMAFGLPVIAADVPPMLRVLEETGGGVAFGAGDPADLARAIAGLAGDGARLRRCAEAGRAAVARTYNWGVDGARLRDAVERP